VLLRCCKNAESNFICAIYQCAREEEGVDDLVFFEETSGCVDEQALEEVILDVHQTLIQLLRLVRDIDWAADWTGLSWNKVVNLKMLLSWNMYSKTKVKNYKEPELKETDLNTILLIIIEASKVIHVYFG
jgi:hypothetical protein